MKVFTYFEPVPQLWEPSTQLRLIEIWKRSWAKHGWTPVVLNEESARRHPRYAEFKKKFWELPTEYGHDYEGACFMRYAATAIQKQPMSMLTDYDVLNYGFTPEHALAEQRKYRSHQLIFMSDDKIGSVATGAALGPWELFEGISHIFANWTPEEKDRNINSKTYNGLHCSDLTCVILMLRGVVPNPGWIHRSHGSVVWPHEGWETSPMVHYGYELHQAGLWPKCDVVEGLRPL